MVDIYGLAGFSDCLPFWGTYTNYRDDAEGSKVEDYDLCASISFQTLMFIGKAVATTLLHDALDALGGYLTAPSIVGIAVFAGDGLADTGRTLYNLSKIGDASSEAQKRQIENYNK